MAKKTFPRIERNQVSLWFGNESRHRVILSIPYIWISDTVIALVDAQSVSRRARHCYVTPLRYGCLVDCTCGLRYSRIRLYQRADRISLGLSIGRLFLDWIRIHLVTERESSSEESLISSLLLSAALLVLFQGIITRTSINMNFRRGWSIRCILITSYRVT